MEKLARIHGSGACYQIEEYRVPVIEGRDILITELSKISSRDMDYDTYTFLSKTKFIPDYILNMMDAGLEVDEYIYAYEKDGNFIPSVLTYTEEGLEGVKGSPHFHMINNIVGALMMLAFFLLMLFVLEKFF